MGETTEPTEIEITVKTVEKKGKYPTIIIPKSTLEYAEMLYGTNLYKLDITNDEHYTYYWKYKSKREQEITFKGLKPGKYKIKIKPYTLKDFLREFNREMEGRLSLTLNLEGGLLLANFNGIYASTNKWNYDKEKGCGVVILAKYPSVTRMGYEVTLKYQMKLGEANLWVVEPRGDSRPAVYKIEDIEAETDSISLYYRHGKKLKKTSIKIKDVISPERYYPKPEAIKLLSTQETYISGKHVLRHRYSIVDNEVFKDIDSMIRESYKDLKEGRVEEFTDKRDEIGKKMAIHFLSIHGLKDFVVEPAKNKEHEKVFKQMLGDKRPDIIGFKDDIMYLIEAKFRFYENDGRKALSRAIFQINQYFRKLKKEVLEEHFERRIMEIKKVVVIVGFDHRINQGYIIYWRE